MLNRRRFAVVAAGGALSVACGPRRASIAPPTLSLPKVNVADDRIIRRVVGLRPFRPSGFVVRVEKVGDKTVVHNYGHGGGGVTLSWGTASLAADEAMQTGARRMAVLGAGGVGLATARLLVDRGVAVTVYAKSLPPDTTSNIAAAQWFPTTVFDRGRSPQFLPQLVRAAELSYRRFQLLVGGAWGVRWIPNYVMRAEPFPEGGLTATLRHLLPGLEDLPEGRHPFPYRYVRRFHTMFIETPVYMEALVRDVRLAGVTIVVRELRDRQEIAALPEPVIVNCTGLGAKALFGDDELTPVKGQLTVLLPQPEIDYAALLPDLYMFPRRDGILLGGTHEEGNWDLAFNQEAEARIVPGHAKFFREMR